MMNKRGMMIVLIIVLAMTIAGCGNKSVNNEAASNTNNTPIVAPVTQEADNTSAPVSEEHPYQKDDELPFGLYAKNTTQSYSIDAMDIVSRAGVGFFASRDGVYTIYDDFVSRTSDTEYGVDPTAIKTPDQVIEGMNKQFLATAPLRLQTIGAEDFVITNKENVTINGWDMCRYEGHFLLEEYTTIKDRKAQFIAYGIIKEEHPVYFIVVDNTDEQDQGERVARLANKIAKTFRLYDGR